MFRTQPRIPENLGIIKPEDRACFLCFYLKVVVAGVDFKVEDAVFVVGIQSIGFVDDGADGRVFVEDYLAD